MLKDIQKKLTTNIFNQEGTTMSKENEAVALAVADLTTKLSETETSLAAKVAELSQASELVQELTGKLAEVEKQLADLAAAKADMEAAAAAAALAARKEKIVAAVGTEKSEALLAATTGLDDASFEAVVGALATSVATEAKSGLFVEKGVTAEVDTSKVVEESPEMARIKQEFKV